MLKNNPGEYIGTHAAWNFNGVVYYNNGGFYEDVYVTST